MSLQWWTNNKTNKSYKQLIYIHISCKCDTNRAGHFTLDAHASRPVACQVACCCDVKHCSSVTHLSQKWAISHWFRKLLNNADPIHWRIYATLRGDGLMCNFVVRKCNSRIESVISQWTQPQETTAQHRQIQELKYHPVRIGVSVSIVHQW